MPTFFTLHLLDIAAIVGYFLAVMALGFWAARRVKDEKDFFMGGRRFGKGLLVMHWLCTGTHSEMAVQVAGATARVGLGGIWYQWMYLFSTPFYWMIAPVTRRLRVLTTGDFFRIRYGRALEMLYSVVALLYFAQAIATLLLGAGKAISGATGGEIPDTTAVIVLSVLFSTYIMAGGLVAAAYTDFLQGVMIIALSVMLVPAGLAHVGGLEGLHARLRPEMFAITAPPGSSEGDPWAVVALSVLGLVGIVVQPHVMNATGSGKTEMEARVGMCYGNFIKRLLTIAWALSGLIALAHFSDALAATSAEQAATPSALATGAGEQLFGRSVREFLPTPWRGLMIACLIAGVTGAETFMVVASAIFTRNFYVHIVPDRSEVHYLWFGRCASAGMLALSIALAFYAQSVTQLFVNSIKIIGLLGASFWLGVTWRRANAPGVWASVLGGALVWGLLSWAGASAGSRPPAALAPAWLESLALHFADWPEPVRVLVSLAVQFGALIAVSLMTRRPSDERLDPFYARLLTPVGREGEVLLAAGAAEMPESATLGMEGVLLDYRKASRFGYAGLRRLGIELPRLTWFDGAGFLAAWCLVAVLIALLYWLAGWGAT